MPVDQPLTPLATVHWSDLKRGDEWIDDHARTNCYTCDRKFTLFRRRHHCRMCGEVVCTSCTGFVNMIAAGGPTRSIRICGGCLVKNRARIATDRPAFHRGTTQPISSMAVSAPGVRSRARPQTTYVDSVTACDRPRFSDVSSTHGDEGDDPLHISAETMANLSHSLPPPPMPMNETARLAALRQYNILDTPPERAYQAIADLLAKGYNCPFAGVSFIDADRIWYKAVTGIAVEALPRTVSFCSHAVMTTAPTVILDTAVDPRVMANPLVTGDLHIKFYAAAPIVAEGNHVIGTVFVFDTKPHGAMISETYLSSMARMVRKQLDARIAHPVVETAPVVWRGNDATPNEMHTMLAKLLHRTTETQAQLASQQRAILP
ncbi:hypothetical protein ACHHYP_16634 [Achlya hypogyna]|uniref:FYVE-type domain-containing protein n=1 Tax=Achlya hypogyna TaxID=1202772 RepID=A0A1V9Y6C1_ACHHY|nr:hypothetical protein ACHHYP_16634 [Achlya hypogyna]